MKISGAKGFALIELLVVLSIIGVLSGMVLVSVSEAKEKARDTKRVQEITQINTAIQLYKSDHEGKAPTFNGACSYDVQDLGPHNGYCVAISGEISGGGYSTEWQAFKDEIGPYMNNNVPDDPCGSNCGDGFGYVYIAPAAVGNATSDEDYQIYATLERTTNKKTGVSTTDDDFVDPSEDEEDEFAAPVIHSFTFGPVPNPYAPRSTKLVFFEVSNAVLCVADDEFGNSIYAASPLESPNPNQSSFYNVTYNEDVTLTCYGEGGDSVSQTITITY